MPETVDFQTLCGMIGNHLAELRGEDLAEVYRMITEKKATYNGELQVFTIEA